MSRKIGNRIAPPRFIAYAVALVGVGVWAALSDRDALEVFLIGFNVATFVFLLSLIPLFRVRAPAAIASHAEDNDANRAALLVIAVVLSLVVLGALTKLVTGRNEYSAWLVVSTLALTWLLANTVYAVHYAHLYYGRAKGQAGDGHPAGYAGGLSIPSTDKPDYFDFLHFSLILGMTFQTADINITSRAIRRVSTGHCLVAFVFNIGILAFSINMIAGS